jgi:ribosomal protein L37AE/L43A
LYIQGFTKYNDIVDTLQRKDMEGRGKRDFRQMMGSMSRESAQVANYGGGDSRDIRDIGDIGDIEDIGDISRNKKSKSSANNVTVDANPNKAKNVCTYCNRPGHSRATCFDLVPCSKCGVVGHGTRYCKGAKAVSNNVNSNRYAPKKVTSMGSNGTKLVAPKVKDSFLKKKPFKAKST